MSNHSEMQTGSGLLSFNFCTRDEFSHARLPEDLRSGSMDAFSHLVSDYKTLVFQFFHRLSVDNAFAEASAEMVFVRAFRARRILRKSTDLTSWIFRIACSLAKRLAPAGSGNCGVDGRPPIQRAMAALPEEKRIAILLHRFAGLDPVQIGSVLRLPERLAWRVVRESYSALHEQLLLITANTTTVESL
ncbi:hypothetical protein BH10ACI4_BH10ACI4_05910 [soil metagenome]